MIANTCSTGLSQNLGVWPEILRSTFKDCETTKMYTYLYLVHFCFRYSFYRKELLFCTHLYTLNTTCWSREYGIHCITCAVIDSSKERIPRVQHPITNHAIRTTRVCHLCFCSCHADRQDVGGWVFIIFLPLPLNKSPTS